MDRQNEGESVSRLKTHSAPFAHGLVVLVKSQTIAIRLQNLLYDSEQSLCLTGRRFCGTRFPSPVTGSEGRLAKGERGLQESPDVEIWRLRILERIDNDDRELGKPLVSAVFLSRKSLILILCQCSKPGKLVKATRVAFMGLSRSQG